MNLQCPHCLNWIFAAVSQHGLGNDASGQWAVTVYTCPSCKRFFMHLLNWPEGAGRSVPKVRMIHPRGISRNPVPACVPNDLAEDYKEACLVLPDSPKASAALSRRCLQHLLRDTVEVTRGNLSSEIQQLLDSGKLPTQLAESVDAIRAIGNFSAHPLKSTSTGEIIDVEPAEAEWNLDTLESLFDFYFVQPEITATKKAAVNEKLKAAGKPPLK